MPATTRARPARDVNHNKFEPDDMPEIRRIRSFLLKSFKLEAKLPRVDIITKAIIPDIDWNKLGLYKTVINWTDDELVEELESINTTITNFRKELAPKIAYIITETVDCLKRTTGSTPEIFEAASTMAHKYHNREKKPTARPRPNKPSTSKNPRRPKPAPIASARHLDQSPQPTSRPTSPTRINPSTPPTSPKPSTSTTHGHQLPNPSTKLQKSTPAPTVPHPSTSQSQRLPKASSNLHKSTPTPEMSQPTITSKFPATKRRSTTKTAPPLPNSRFSHQIPFNFGWN